MYGIQEREGNLKARKEIGGYTVMSLWESVSQASNGKFTISAPVCHFQHIRPMHWREFELYRNFNVQ